MTDPVRLDVFSDYLCPWCYNAAVRLHDIEQEYGDRLRIHWRTFPLIPDRQPGRRVTEKTREGRRRVGAEEPRALFVPPDLDSALPASSVPALTAAKCAERQSAGAFARFHSRLFVAHFRDNLDISRPDVLSTVARECGLDVERLQTDYAKGDAYQAVLHDCAEGTAWFGVSALPTVIFNEKLALVGAVPTERYREMIDWILAGQPGGVIPLAPAGVAAAAAGQSRVEDSRARASEAD
jgi:predicted DsbA family dithiol-disulfide isomerase